MSYKIEKNDKGKFCVIDVADDGSTETLGCHETKEAAQDQLTAIGANAHSERFADWDECMAAMAEEGYDDETAAKICNKICNQSSEEPPEPTPSEGPQHREPRGFYMRAYCQREGTADAAEGTPIRFVASTEGIKRDGKDLKATDWRMDNYKRNPVVLWAHDYTGARLPIGKADVSMEKTNMLADVTFDQGDEFARQVESKYRRGFLNAVSVGWNDEKGGGRDLLDISAVPVPADPQALMQRQMDALAELARSFDGWASGVVPAMLESRPGQAEDMEPLPEFNGTEVRMVDGERKGAKMSARDLEKFGEALRILQELYDEQKAARKPEDEDAERAIADLISVRDRLNKLTEGVLE